MYSICALFAGTLQRGIPNREGLEITTTIYSHLIFSFVMLCDYNHNDHINMYIYIYIYIYIYSVGRLHNTQR